MPPCAVPASLEVRATTQPWSFSRSFAIVDSARATATTSSAARSSPVITPVVAPSAPSSRQRPSARTKMRVVSARVAVRAAVTTGGMSDNGRAENVISIDGSAALSGSSDSSGG